MGRIGTEVAKRARGFGMTTLYFDEVRKKDVEDSLQISYTSVDNLLSQSDIVTIHANLTPKTKGLIGEKSFR